MSDPRHLQPPPVQPESPEVQLNPSRPLVRSCVACRRCHAQKVKCNGETPCRNCKGSKTPVECVYPVRDRKVTVSERYLRKLEAQVLLSKRKAPSPELEPATHDQTQCQADDVNHCNKRTRAMVPVTELDGSSGSPSEQNFVSEDEVETFLDEMSIQPTYVGEAACTTFGNKLSQFLRGKDTPPPTQRPRYYKDFKMLRTSCTECELPSRSDAQLLVRVVLRFVGADYHLLRKRSFMERLDETYKLTVLDDPIWLCRLFTVFALGEVYSVRSSKPKGHSVPGTAFFVKAIEYFQDLYEEPSIDYIETLLLLSFYSVTLNRRNTAYAYTGLALRLSLMLGLHRKVENGPTMTAPEREHRIRVWWTVYCLDRLMSSKVGHPAMIQDEDIDTQLPSMDGLSPQDMQDFHDPANLVAQIQLSRITGNVLSNIYHIPQPGRANTFIHGVQKTLTSLRNFHRQLPPHVRLDTNNSPMYANRSVASLHLHFNQCVILTTRPVLFYIFRSRFIQYTDEISEVSQPVSPMTSALAEACIQAARISNRILSQLWVDGCLAIYGFYDAVSIFSSTLVLMISSTMKKPENDVDADGIDTAWSLMRSMKDEGNVPINDYFDQLVHLKQDLEDACARRKCFHQAQPQLVGGLPLPTTEIGNPQETHGFAAQNGTLPPPSTSAGDVPNNPFKYASLVQPQANWDPNVFDSILSSINEEQNFWNVNSGNVGAG